MYRRFIQILENLLTSKEFTISELASKYNVSKQTIKNDLENINEFLSRFDLEPITYDKRGIYKGKGILSGKDTINKYVINNLYSYRLSKDELVILAVILIILSDNYVTINDVADNLLVSRTTFINSLPDMKSYFKHLDLEFKSSSKKGMKIVNSELERRIALLKLIDEIVMENRFLMNIVLKNELFFDEDFRDIIKPILSDAFSHFDKKVTSKSFSVLEYYLCISVQRMLNGHYLDKIDSHVSDNTDFSLYIFQKLKEEYGFEINEDEIHFVDAICDSTIGKTKDSSPIQQSLSIQLLAAKLIEDVSGDMGIDFADDMDLQKCLTNHLTSIYLQKKYEINNHDVLDDIKKNYQDLIDVVRKHVGLIEIYFEKKLTEEEIIYLVIHFGAARRRKWYETSFHALLVCEANVGTLELIKSKLRQMNSITIVRTITSYELAFADLEDIDIIISTMFLSNTKKPSVQISELVTSNDLLAISNLLESLFHKHNHFSKINRMDLFKNEIQPILEKYTTNSDFILNEILKKAEMIFFNKKEMEIPLEVPSLSTLLLEELITLDVDCIDWKESIYKSCDTLIKYGYIRDKYIQSIIELTEEYGPYYIIAPEIAIAHAESKGDCLRTGISYTRLNRPILFVNEMLVRHVFTFSINENISHLEALYKLYDLVRTKEFNEFLNTFNRPDELIQYIKKS